MGVLASLTVSRMIEHHSVKFVKIRDRIYISDSLRYNAIK
jgi:hypothetical protein